jgi:peptidoglycan/LPS O-acetylase OafA/YrhL
MLAALCIFFNLVRPGRLPAVLLVFLASYGHRLVLGPKPHTGMAYYLGACAADALALVAILSLRPRRLHTRLAFVLLCAIVVNALSFVAYEAGAAIYYPNKVAIYTILTAQTLIMCWEDGDGPSPISAWRRLGVRAYMALHTSAAKIKVGK